MFLDPIPVLVVAVLEGLSPKQRLPHHGQAGRELRDALIRDLTAGRLQCQAVRLQRRDLQLLEFVMCANDDDKSSCMCIKDDRFQKYKRELNCPGVYFVTSAQHCNVPSYTCARRAIRPSAMWVRRTDYYLKVARESEWVVWYQARMLASTLTPFPRCEVTWL